MSDSFTSGITGTATVDGVELAVVSWDCNPSSEVQRFRNSRTQGFTVKQPTYKDARFSITLDYDLQQDPFEGLPNIDVGTILTNVNLYRRNSAAFGAVPAGPAWNFPQAICVSTPERMNVDGKIVTTLNCESSGPWGRPGHPASSAASV